ncbi:MAG: hypothetical protein CMG84_13645 [Marinobacter sp.]|nr:hypothetical protein [Marinobacter sp.]
MSYGELKSPLKNTFTDILGGAVSGAAQGSTAGLPGAILGGVLGGAGGFLTGRANDKIDENLAEKQDEFQSQLDAFTSAEITNPFAGMTNAFEGIQNPLEKISTENKFEDLTVNLKSADYQRQMAEESQAAILQSARAGAGGAGGIASIAGLLAKQNAQVRQQIAADIGAQEATNQRLKAQGAEQARQAEFRIADAQRQIDMAQAQAGMNIQQLEAKGAMDVQRMQAEREALGLGYQAQQQENTNLFNSILGAAPTLINAFSGTGSNNQTGSLLDNLSGNVDSGVFEFGNMSPISAQFQDDE